MSDRMLPPWASNKSDLDRYAESHIYYEVFTLLEQVNAIYTVPRTGPTSDLPSPLFDALLEASLVHFRLLDDFLGRKRNERSPKTSVFACDWPGSWKPKSVLTHDVHSRIDRELAHLSSDRLSGRLWDLGSMTNACCQTLLEFFDSLDPERASAFKKSRELVEGWPEMPANRLLGSSGDASAGVYGPTGGAGPQPIVLLGKSGAKRPKPRPRG